MWKKSWHETSFTIWETSRECYCNYMCNTYKGFAVNRLETRQGIHYSVGYLYNFFGKLNFSSFSLLRPVSCERSLK